MARLKRSKKTTRSSRRPARAGKNSSSVEKMQLGLKQRLLSPTLLIISGAIAGILLIFFLLVLWFVKIYADPEHVFWATLRNNLATQSITKDSVRKSRASANQEFTQIGFTPELRVHDLKEITDNTVRPSSKLTLETIGTINDDYQRYSHIERPHSTKTQKDYQSIYDSWLKNGGQEGGQGQIVGNTVFSAVLFGDFDSTTRGQLFGELKKAYHINFAKTNKHGDMHRRTYVYHATIQLQQYAKAAHDYASALGLPLATQINPNNYQPTDVLDVNITVDVLSREIKRIDYPSQNFTENYSGQGNVPNIKLPSKTVSASSFQNTIKALNQ